MSSVFEAAELADVLQDVGMVDFEWNQERALEIAQKEGISRGMVIGMKKVIAKKKAEGDLNRARIVQDELILYMLKEDFDESGQTAS